MSLIIFKYNSKDKPSEDKLSEDKMSEDKMFTHKKGVLTAKIKYFWQKVV